MRPMNLVLAVFFIALLYLLPSYDKCWAPYDEGDYLNTSMMVLKGMTPYKDYFLIMYPPGHAYTLAALLKVFGMHLYVGRFYNIIVLSVILATVFYIAGKVASRGWALFSFVMCLGVFSSLGEPSIPRAIWPGVMWSMITLACLLEFIEKEKTGYLAAASVSLGITLIFRHDIAFLTFLSGCVGLTAHALYGPRRGAAGRIAVRSVGLAAGPVICAVLLTAWLYRMGALNDAFRAMFVEPSAFHRWGAIPFPPYIQDPGAIFHRGCIFIRHNKFYIPVIICASSVFLFISDIFIKKRLDKRLVLLSGIITLAVLYLQQLVFRVDDNHLAVSFAPSAVLLGSLFSHRAESRNRPFKVLEMAMLSYVGLLAALLLYHSTERYIKDIYTKPFVKKEVEPAVFERGTIYIPDDVRPVFVELEKFIRENTAGDERIYIGPLRHNVPQIGWFDLLYFLTDRVPAVKYYVMIPGFQTRRDIQEEMIRSLEINNTRFLFLRDFGRSEDGLLDTYIKERYSLVKVIDSYYIYGKR
ncbi:MAG: glycosyltransferase family 39 protein [Candidatus Omnitrophota bacterium]